MPGPSYADLCGSDDCPGVPVVKVYFYQLLHLKRSTFIVVFLHRSSLSQSAFSLFCFSANSAGFAAGIIEIRSEPNDSPLTWGNVLMLVLSQESTKRTGQEGGGGFGMRADFLLKKRIVC